MTWALLTWTRARLVRHRRFVAFCAVGGSGVLVNMAVYLSCLHLLGGSDMLQVNLAALAGWVVSVASNFVLNDRLTFRDAERGYSRSVSRRLWRYYASASVAFVIQAAVLNGVLLALTAPWLAGLVRGWADGAAPWRWPWLLLVSWPRSVANLAGIGIATVANYLLARNWVFRKSDVASDG